MEAQAIFKSQKSWTILEELVFLLLREIPWLATAKEWTLS